MKNFLIAVLVALTLPGALSAAAATIQTTDGKTHNAQTVVGDTVMTLTWRVDRTTPGRSFKPWEISAVRYSGSAMDAFNSLARKMAGGLGESLQKDAEFYLAQQPMAGFSREQWDTNILHVCRYYLAQSYRVRGDYKKAIEAFEQFFTECEKSPLPSQTAVSYTSPFSKRAVQNAAGLHRLYLDGLEAYNDCLLREGRSEDSQQKAIKALDDLTQQLARTGVEYYNWVMRALRVSGRFAEDAKDYRSARRYYETLQTVALRAGGGSRPTRASMEAQLRVGFMRVKEGDSGARAVFITATRAWEAGYNNNGTSMARTGWVSADDTYFTAGCYVGQGMAEAASARGAAEWTRALQNFSTSLSIFRSDEEIRTMGLLGAAEAASKLAELSSSNAVAATNYAKLGEKYLAELLNLYPKSRAAEDEKVTEIQKRIQTVLKK